jgi:[ribosomal protein S18]-alanine N-acetyltransferase
MTAHAVEIRPAISADVSAIVAIEQQAPGASHWTAQEYERVLISEVVLVAEEGGAVVGFLCAKQAADDWELENIAVAPAFQRRGVAGELLRAWIGRFCQRVSFTVFLEVRESNLPARRFYEKNGFVEVGRRRQYYRQPDEDAVVYKLAPGSRY